MKRKEADASRSAEEESPEGTNVQREKRRDETRERAAAAEAVGTRTCKDCTRTATANWMWSLVGEHEAECRRVMRTDSLSSPQLSLSSLRESLEKERREVCVRRQRQQEEEIENSQSIRLDVKGPDPGPRWEI